MDNVNLLLDTQVFESVGYNFEAKSFQAIQQLVREKTISLYITRVIDAEIETHIRERSSHTINQIGKAIRESRLLSPVDPFSKIIEKGYSEEVLENLISGYQAFKEVAEVHMIDAGIVNTAELMTAYANKKPPFDTPKKKFEFPDAISLLCADSYFTARSETAVVVSGDKDITKLLDTLKIGDRLIAGGELATVLDSLIEKTDQKSNITDLVQANIESVLDQLNADGVVSQLMPIGDDAEIVDGTFVDLEVEDVRVIKLDSKYALAELVVQVIANLQIEYNDIDSTYYDSETKSHLVFNRNKNYYRVPIFITVEIEFIRSPRSNKWVHTVMSPGGIITFDFDPHSTVVR